MDKKKTNKSVLKRFKITKDGRVLHRAIGQNHFRAKKTGKQRRLARRWKELSGTQAKTIKRYLPYL